MSAPDLDVVLRWRAASELARMTDLQRVLPFAAAGGAAGREVNLAHRISVHRQRVESMPVTSAGWSMVSSHGKSVDRLIDELIALLMTRTLRNNGLDGGTFDAAEDFLDEIIGLAGVPPLVLGQSRELESVDHTLASVAMRFPGSRVWDLPFLAHEVGHHAVANLPHYDPALADNRPLAEVVGTVAEKRSSNETADEAEKRAHELVADVIATIICGAIYPLSCLSLRVPFGPAATRITGDHPAWTERIAACCAALDCMSQRTKHPRFTNQRAKQVDPLALSVLGTVPSRTPAALLAAGSTVAAMLKHRPLLFFDDADMGIKVKNALTASDSSPPSGTSVRAILDGAWRWRLNRSDASMDDAMAALVISYCRTASSGGHP